MNDVTSNGQDLNRSPGPLHLVFFAVGCIIGSGTFVLTGNVLNDIVSPGTALAFSIVAPIPAFLRGART